LTTKCSLSLDNPPLVPGGEMHGSSLKQGSRVNIRMLLCTHDRLSLTGYQNREYQLIKEERVKKRERSGFFILS